MIGALADYRKLLKTKDMPCGGKVQLHETALRRFRVTVFDADDEFWLMKDKIKLSDAEGLFDQINEFEDISK